MPEEKEQKKEKPLFLQRVGILRGGKCMSEGKEQKKEKPFYKTKDFWLEVTRVAVQAGIAFGVAYLANKREQK